MLQLVKPSKQYYKQYKEMMDEWNMEGSRIAPWPLHLKYHTEELFEEMLKRVEEVERGEKLIENAAASTTYWLYDDETNTLDGIPYEDDMYLDVVVTPSGDIILLDEDEFKDAYDRKEMTKAEFDEAYKIANELMKKLNENKDQLKEYTDNYLKKFLKEYDNV